MNKTFALGAVAVMTLAFSLEAMAGEPVFGDPTVYGRVNLSLERARVDSAETNTRFVDNGSRLGLRAGGSIGNGTEVTIQIEGRLRNDPNGWIVKSRDTWIGLQDAAMGIVRFGMMEGPLYHATCDEISMHNHDSGRSADKLLAEDATGGRMPKAIYYQAPKIGAFRFEALHAFLTKDPTKVNASNPGHDEFALTYEAEESWIAGGYAESRNLKVDQALTIAGATTVGNFVLAGLYEKSATTPFGATTVYRNYVRFAGKYSAGKHEFHVNYGVAGRLSTMPDSGATQATIGYNYNLTEQAKIYAFATRVSNGSNASYGFLENTPNGLGNTSVALGLRHNF